MAKMLGVPALAVPSVWPDVLPFIQGWLDKSKEHRWEASDILTMLNDSELQLWVIHDDGIRTIVLTQLLNYPRCRECNIYMVSGELTDDWREHCDSLVTWAEAQGCHYVTAMARKGFAKAMGWDERQTYIVRN